MEVERSFPSPAEYVAKCRAVLKSGEYFLIPQENRCSGDHVNLRNAEIQVLVTPKQGAGYLMYELRVHPGGGAIDAFDDDLESFIFLIEGAIELKLGNASQELAEGGFAWIPPRQPIAFTGLGTQAARLLWFRRPYEPLKGHATPIPLFGNEKNVPAVAEVDLNPEKRLIPYENPAFDMAFNLIVVPPGAFYGLVEMHAWEHAMYMLDGEGFLFLNGQFHLVKENDFIYVAPYCPEFFCALGMQEKPVRFLLYWDWNRDYSSGFGKFSETKA